MLQVAIIFRVIWCRLLSDDYNDDSNKPDVLVKTDKSKHYILVHRDGDKKGMERLSDAKWPDIPVAS